MGAQNRPNTLLRAISIVKILVLLRLYLSVHSAVMTTFLSAKLILIGHRLQIIFATTIDYKRLQACFYTPEALPTTLPRVHQWSDLQKILIFNVLINGADNDRYDEPYDCQHE